MYGIRRFSSCLHNSYWKSQQQDVIHITKIARKMNHRQKKLLPTKLKSFNIIFFTKKKKGGGGGEAANENKEGEKVHYAVHIYIKYICSWSRKHYHQWSFNCKRGLPFLSMLIVIMSPCAENAESRSFTYHRLAPNKWTKGTSLFPG